jgi:multiple inositol-polyphosphate phosphatase/2,3-bisphosphoglycerate 3-phosphatase
MAARAAALVLCAAGAAAGIVLTENMATKTPYNTHCDEWREAIPTHYGCRAGAEPAYVEYVARHGTRYPMVSDMGRLVHLESILRENEEMLRPQYQWMANWTSPYQAERGGALHSTGVAEHFGIGHRWRMDGDQNGTLAPPYAPWRYRFSTTDLTRTFQSAAAFGSGVFGVSRDDENMVPVYLTTVPRKDDSEMRFFDHCPLYTSQHKAMKAPAEAWAARHGEDLALRVQARISDDDVPWVDFKVASYMWRACAFEVALQRDNSRFCTAFSDADFLAMDFYFDLKTYYLKGPGTPLATAIAYPLADSIRRGLQRAANCEGECPLAAHFRFAHAETLLPLVALLGLFGDDPPLDASWTPAQQSARVWRSSQIAPFGANLRFNLYTDCSAGPIVELVHNEAQLPWPGRDSAYLPLDEFTVRIPGGFETYSGVQEACATGE